MKAKPIKISVPVPPSANRYWRHAAVYSKRARRWIATTYLSEEAESYRDAVRLPLLSRGVRPLRGPLRLTITFYRAQKSGDLGNRLKVIEDVLQTVAYFNDSQIEEIHLYRRECPARPRLDVDIEQIESPQADLF